MLIPSGRNGVRTDIKWSFRKTVNSVYTLCLRLHFADRSQDRDTTLFYILSLAKRMAHPFCRIILKAQYASGTDRAMLSYSGTIGKIGTGRLHDTEVCNFLRIHGI
jgi:hypothetical protein